MKSLASINLIYLPKLSSTITKTNHYKYTIKRVKAMRWILTKLLDLLCRLSLTIVVVFWVKIYSFRMFWLKWSVLSISIVKNMEVSWIWLILILGTIGQLKLLLLLIICFVCKTERLAIILFHLILRRLVILWVLKKIKVYLYVMKVKALLLTCFIFKISRVKV